MTSNAAPQLEYVELNVDSVWPNKPGLAGFRRNNWAVIDIPQDLTDIKALRVVEAIIPKTFYNYQGLNETSPLSFFADNGSGLVFGWYDIFDPSISVYETTLQILPGNYTAQLMCDYFNSRAIDGYLDAWLNNIPNLAGGSTPTIRLEFDIPTQSFNFKITATMNPPNTSLFSNYRGYIRLESRAATATNIGRFWGTNDWTIPGLVPFSVTESHLAATYYEAPYVVGKPRVLRIIPGQPARINFPPYLTLGSTMIGSLIKSVTNSAVYEQIYDPNAVAIVSEFQGYKKYDTIVPYSPFGVAIGSTSYQITTIPIPTDVIDNQIIWTNPEEKFFEIPTKTFTQLDFFFMFGKTTEIVDFRGSGFSLKIGLLVEKKII